MRERLHWLIEWTADSQAAAVEHVGVDHGGLDVLVAQEFLNGVDDVAIFK